MPSAFTGAKRGGAKDTIQKMTNKMNIDMGDFFGSGSEVTVPAKKDGKVSSSRFGFSPFKKKSIAAGQLGKQAGKCTLD